MKTGLNWLVAAWTCVLLAGSHAGAGPEPWADPSLPLKEGLSIWLDAGRQPAAWQAHARPPLGNGNDLDVFYDASGNRRHFVQSFRAARPKFVAGDKAAALRFDGENDHLHCAAGPRELESFTLILAAAPKSNLGAFRGLLSAAEPGKNDYVAGLNVDLGPNGSGAFEVLNVEGAGFGGFRNLSQTPLPFRQLHVIAIVGDASSIAAHLNGKPQAKRNRTTARLRSDHLFLASRYYSNEAAPPFVSGFLDGDVAEVLLYDRALSPAELESVSAYVAKKHERYAYEVARAGEEGELLRPLENPPDVQVFVPGFTARRLPLDLTNINNLRYREDGKLVALAYDGNVYLLSDTDNDGLEDKADQFWDNRGRIVSPIGMALTPPGYKLGQGLFVACKGKVSLIHDTDGDNVADKETIVAQGWKPLPHQVDALGVAVGPDGSVYFGLGTTNFTNAYLTDAAGNAKYSLKDERGTILKVSPDFSKREIVCTGIRFPVGMAFNRHADLFATDQEGATWLPNGNPFDELLHIQAGRHYGFPPRHPKHLPNVIDEPSVFDYTPQHQSTCGLFFNEPVNGGPVFGPKFWQDDALVCGESRGKLYRTQLAKTPAGYVARNHLIASLTMLTVDACVSPAGDLVVATHSGNPDWGSGPTGKGRLYRIRYADKSVAQPLACWPAGPHEVRVAFDRPLDPALLRDVAKNASITYGPSVAAGDRFEKIRPGYAVVQQQVSQARRELAINGLALTPDRRTLVISTARQSLAVNYALTLPTAGRGEPTDGGIKQVDAIDLAYDLSGAAVEWQPNDASRQKWVGHVPHLDLSVARTFTAGSAEHEALWPSISQPGRLTVRTSLDLWNVLRPEVQPGSRIDYTLPPERVTVTLESNVALEVRSPDAKPQLSKTGDGQFRAALNVSPKEAQPLPIELTFATGQPEPTLTVTLSTEEDPRPRAIPLRRFLLPWAAMKPEPAPEQVARAEIPQLKGGDWLRGRDVFFGQQAGCATCHRVDGRGGDVGPDLSNLVHRDYDSVLRDIQNPSGALNPDYISSTVMLKDGRIFNGIFRSFDKDHFMVRGDAEGEEAPIHRRHIETITPSGVSMMPPGLDQGLGGDKTRDLLTFLLTRPLEPAPPERPGAPTPRSRAELEAVLSAASESDRKVDTAPLRVLLAAGPKDHGPGEHDYPKWQQRWSKLLAMSDGVRVSTCNTFPSPDQLRAADVAVFYSNNPGWSKEKAADLDAFLDRGGGLVYIHFAIDGHRAPAELAERIGLAWRAGSRFRHGNLNLAFTDKGHPITRGFEKLALIDESYWNLLGGRDRIRQLAAAPEEGAQQPLLWVREHGKGRIFVSVPGHYAWTFDDPLFRVLLLRGIAWSAGRPAERLTHLAPLGARMRD